MRRFARAVATVTLAASCGIAALVAVPATSTAATNARTIEVSGSLYKFAPKKITVAAGERVTIVLHSTDVVHDLVVQGVGRVVTAKAGKTRRGSLMIAKPGKYKFWCSIRGHRNAGMVGTITVR